MSIYPSSSYGAVSSPLLTTQSDLFEAHKDDSDGAVAQLSLRGRTLLNGLQSMRKQRSATRGRLREAQAKLPDLEAELSELRANKVDARNTYRFALESGSANASSKKLAMEKAYTRFDSKQKEVRKLQSKIASLVEKIERMRAKIRRKRAAIKKTARDLRQLLVYGGGKGLPPAEAEVETEGAEAQIHDARADLVAQLSAAQAAALRFTELLESYERASSFLAAREASGGTVTDTDRSRLADLQRDLFDQAVLVLQFIATISALDLTPLSLAGDADEGDDAFGLISSWAYDYDNTARFGSNWAQSLDVLDSPQSSNPSPTDVMNTIDTGVDMVDGFMNTLSTFINAVGNNRNQPVGTNYAPQQPVYTQPPPPQVIYRDPPQTPPPPQVIYRDPPQTPQQNFMPWLFGGVAVLGLGAVTWAVLSD